MYHPEGVCFVIIGYIVLLWLVANKWSDTEWGDDTSKVNWLLEFTVTCCNYTKLFKSNIPGRFVIRLYNNSHTKRFIYAMHYITTRGSCCS